jgi:1-acyl-sn-glycerol-3-phosphate acyltransferase
MGGAFFLLLFCVISLGMTLFSPKTLYPVIQLLARMQLLIMGVRIKVVGLENVNVNRAYIFMGNHESLFDLFAIPATLPLRWIGVEAAYHFSLPLWGYLTRKWGNIPIERKNVTKTIVALRKAAQVIASGTSIVILPEGHRTLTGRVGEFNKGPFFLARKTQADILPFALNGLYQFNNKHSWHLHPQSVSVVYGEPIPYASFKDLSLDDTKDLVREKIIQLKAQGSPEI